MDESFTVLRPRNSELDIFRLADGGIGANIMDMAFIPGKEEVVLVDDTGTSRIMSLTTERLRLAFILSKIPAASCICSFVIGPSDQEPYNCPPVRTRL
jgi:hypothetical protein